MAHITCFHFRPESALAAAALLVMEKAFLDWHPVSAYPAVVPECNTCLQLED
jgi:hypothetical protein